MPAVRDPAKVVQSTVRLPEPLYRQVKELLDQGRLAGNSLNEVMINALKQCVRVAIEKSIDDQFAGMATDEKYAEQCRVIAGEFARADWEALQEDVANRAAR